MDHSGTTSNSILPASIVRPTIQLLPTIRLLDDRVPILPPPFEKTLPWPDPAVGAVLLLNVQLRMVTAVLGVVKIEMAPP